MFSKTTSISLRQNRDANEILILPEKRNPCSVTTQKSVPTSNQREVVELNFSEDVLSSPERERG